MRKDVLVENDSSGWVITSAGRNGRRDEPFADDGEWLREAERGTFLPISLASDGGFIARVVVDEPLTDQEAEEWVDHCAWKLSIPDGQLVLCGGREFVESGDADHLEEYGCVIPIPPGDYRLDVYTHLPSPNCELDEEDDLEGWWRRTRRREKMPFWIRDEEWEGDPENGYLIAWLVHLTPRAAGAPGPSPSPLGDDGWVPLTVAPRVPARCPAGLLSRDVAGLTDREPEPEPTGLTYIHAVPALVAHLQPAPVAGGPVAVPLRDLVRPYWLAWLCGETHPCALLSACPPGLEIAWPGFAAGIQETATEDGWRIDIEGMNARWSQFHHLALLGDLLADLPDGVRLELAAAEDDQGDDDDEDEADGNPPEAGFHRYVGTVRGGAWFVEATWPPLDAATLADMLALAAEAQAAAGFTLRDAAEAERVLAACQRDFLLRDTPPTLRKGRLAFRKADSHLVPFLAARLWLERFGSVWPSIGRDDDVEGWDAAMDAIADVGAAWATGETILEGRFARFTRSDLAALGPEIAERGAALDAAMAALGFQSLGEVHSTQTFAGQFRGYGRPGGHTWGALVTNGFGSFSADFYTRFASGASLTTSRGDEPADRRRKIHRQGLPKSATEAELLAAHEARVAELAPTLGDPLPAEPSLTAFAAALDEFMARVHALK